MIEILSIFVEASRWASVRMDRDEWSSYGRDVPLPRDERPDAITAPWLVAEAERLQRNRKVVEVAVKAARNQATDAVRAYQRAYWHRVRKLDAAAMEEHNRKRREAYAAKRMALVEVKR